MSDLRKLEFQVADKGTARVLVELHNAGAFESGLVLVAARLPLLRVVQATRLPFVPVPGMPSQQPPTSMKMPGSGGLRVDLLAPSRSLGAVIAVPELDWHAQGVPGYDYLLEGPAVAAVLAGGSCIAVRLPRPERFVWHKLYSSASRVGAPEKAAKDLLQAVTLAAALIEQHDEPLADSIAEAPLAIRSAARKRLPAIRRALAVHPQTLEQLELALG